MINLLKKPLVIRSIFVVLLVAPVLVIATVPGWRPADMMAEHLGKQLDDVPDRLVAAQLQQIARLDQAGTRELVKALGHPRDIVADLAGSTLHAQLDNWSQMRSSESSPRVAQLIQLLAPQVDQWDASKRSIAADLATRILRWPIDSQAVVETELLARCEHVLQLARGEQPGLQTVALLPDNASGRAVAASHAATTDSSPSGMLGLSPDDIPGGGLSTTEVPIPPMPPSLANPPSPRPVYGDEPDLIPPSGRQLPRVMFPDERPAKEPTSVFPTSPVPHQLLPDSEADPHMSELAPAAATLRSEDLEQLPDLDLIRRLNRSTSVELQAVEQQLRRRGFDDLQLSLARKVADPDPQVRRKLAESLTNMRTAPGPWLFWLSYDPSPTVRQLVVSLMATSPDPRLQRRLREMQSLETDEMVRRQLEPKQQEHRRR